MTIWPNMQPQPTNGNPFITADDWNEFVNSIIYLDEHTSILEALYSGGGIPLGSAIMWYGTESTVPEGWQICDGTNGTQDLRNAFIMGASDDASVGLKSGSELHVHAGGVISAGGSHSHSANGKSTGGYSGSTGVTGSGSWITPVSHTHSDDVTISTGGSHGHEIGTSGQGNILPPYKKLFWITRLP